MRSLHVEVVTPRGAAASAEAESVVAPGVLGELGVLPLHLPLLTGIRPGLLRLVTGRAVQVLAVGNGFMEVGAGDRVLVLVESCERPDQVDEDDARRDLAAAEAKLRIWSKPTAAEFDGVLDDRAWARARLDAAASRRS